jgi:hypothetical protein
MTITMRRRILRANALWLVVAASGGLLADVLGIFFARGPQRIIAVAPHTGVGFIEAHGLALIFGVLLWRAAPARSWSLTAAAVHALLGAANLVFWQFFIAADMLAAGYITTSLHWLFVAIQLFAATTAPRASAPPAGMGA